MKRALDFLVGLTFAGMFVWFLICMLSLAGCATGVQMTDDERIACRDAGCTPWTEAELRDLVQRAVTGGYRKGWTDAVKQGDYGL